MLNLQVAIELKAARRTKVRTPPLLVDMSVSEGSDSEDDVGSDVSPELVLLLSLHDEV